ncbi:branched-chain amino acid ABC transporter permease [Arthrobacter sp. NPDC089319]|uniref:branched-chain amino acid ABC transporter permease n=1 Tax=Arthrobacter sp. NPDC089319 TaxID=3155915 RepID=UPI003425865B
MEILGAGIGFGLVIGAVLAIAAVGFSLQYSVTNVLNLAFSETMIVSGFVGYWVNSQGMNIWVSALAAIGCGVAVSFLMNRFVYQRFIDKGSSLFVLVVVSLALSMILANLLLVIAGPLSFRYDVPVSTVFSIGGAAFTNVHMVVVVLAALTMVGIHYLLKRTRLGKAMRAASVDPTLAQSCGIPTNRVVNLAWAISGALCGLAGVVYLVSTSTFSATSGRSFVVLVIAAAILGGIGDAYGAMLGALVIGISTELGAIWFDSTFKLAIALAILILVLLVRPQGIRAEFAREREVSAA